MANAQIIMISYDERTISKTTKGGIYWQRVWIVPFCVPFARDGFTYDISRVGYDWKEREGRNGIHVACRLISNNEKNEV